MPENTPPKKGRPRGAGSFAWRAFFQQSATPVYVLGKNRRLRFVNAAWEKLTGLKLADALGMVCSARRGSTPLAAALAPTPEAQAGKPDRARRAAPTGRGGPPWWDVTFAPLAGEGGVVGIVGFVAVAGEPERSAARKLPPAVAALRDRHAGHFTIDLFGGPAPPTARLLGRLRHAAGSAASVWLVGGRLLPGAAAARVVHHAGPRRGRTGGSRRGTAGGRRSRSRRTRGRGAGRRGGRRGRPSPSRSRGRRRARRGRRTRPRGGAGRRGAPSAARGRRTGRT
ncbi:MAG TPA: PAS domain-containing protein [Gemmata sp.]|nr:PAS domain-containing protein [Gemmata sp.]